MGGVNLVKISITTLKDINTFVFNMVRISEDRRFEFGKYKGLTVNEVIKKDPQYVEYLSEKIHWLFNDTELQTLRNLRHRQKNKDICLFNVKSRTPLEEEMYNVFRQL